MHHRILQVRRPCLCHMYSKHSHRDRGKGMAVYRPPPPSPQCHISSDARLPLLDPRAVPLECRAAAAVSALLRWLFDQLRERLRVSIMNTAVTRKKRGITHIRTLPSSPAVANMHGSVGFQATALQLVWCASICCTKIPVNLCQMKTWPSRKADSWVSHGRRLGSRILDIFSPSLPLMTKFSLAPPKSARIV